MSGVLSKLAGETAVYGLSTILARIINFFFVPFYTRILSQEQYGSLTEFMAYIAVLQVVLTLGMETGSFRFANKGPEPRSVFSNAFSSVFSFSFLVFAVMTVFSGDIASYLGYGDYPEVVTYVGLILLLDSSCAILFAKLRYEGRAWRFAVIKTVKIITETAANIFLFLFLPGWIASHPGTFVESLIPPVPDFSYPIVAILVSCVVMVICMIPDFRSIRLHVDRKLLKDMFMYSLPLMIAGLPGVVNEFLDRILFRFCMPDDVSWRAELGIYQAAVKLSVIMSLFIQMFRFAAEPFFFARANDRDSRKIYAEVMNHFVAFCMLIFLGIVLYSDIIGLILGRDFRSGLHILPVMLLSYLFLGILFNVSMWYKLADKTGYAIYITLLGVIVTAVVNVVFMPLYSYTASAWGHLLSYVSMFAVSLYFGQKYYPVPYNWKRVSFYIVSGIAVFLVSLLLPEMSMWIEIPVHAVMILLYLCLYLKVEKINLLSLMRIVKKQ